MIKLKNFPLYKQQTPYTCGYASISMISSFLGKPIKEGEIPKGPLFNTVKGLPPWEFVKIFEKCLPDYSVRLKSPDRKKIPEMIFEQIKNDLPVPVIFSTIDDFDKPHMNMHYSVITGIDKEKTKVILVNPFGYEETMKMGELLDKMAYNNYPHKPLRVRFVLLLGVLKINNIFIIKKTAGQHFA